MAAFSYRAVDQNGRELTGVVEAESPRLARALLRDQKLLPVTVDPVAHAGKDQHRLGRSQISLAGLAGATREWSTLLDAGLSIERALNAVIEQSDDPVIRGIFAGVRAETVAGNSLSNSLTKFQGAFPPVYCAVVGAGERSGQLPRLLERLASYLEAGLASRRRVIGAMIYPALLTLVALAVIGALMVFVVPQIVAVFEQGKQSLPLLTRALIWVSNLVRLLALPMAVILPLAVWVFSRLYRNAGFRRRWQTSLLRLPVIGRLLQLRETERFASTLAILVGSGVPLIDALLASRQVISSLPLQDMIDQATQRVREGVPLHRALAESKAFPPLLIHMVASGETSGRLDEALGRAAVQHQADLDRRVGMMLTLIEPLLILVMGGVVMLIVLAILLPIVNINLLLR
jgi:general secretion pathway protein F